LLASEERQRDLLERLSNTENESELHERAAADYAQEHARYIAEGGLYYKARCASVLSKFGFDETYHHMSPSSLSGGQRTRLALVKLVLREPDILILDEPTNHLDIEALTWLENFLSSYKKTVIVVSHDRYFLDKTTNKTFEIEHHAGMLYNMPYTGFAEQKRIEREVQKKHYKLQQREIKRQEDVIEQQRRWGRERNIIMIKSREKALLRMEKTDKPVPSPKSIRFSMSSSGKSGTEVLSVRGLCMGFGQTGLFSDLSFEVRRGERLFIVGKNGCGKSTLIKLLNDKLTPTGGIIEYGYNVTIGYYDQENQDLTDENTVLAELWNEYPTLTQTQIRNTLAQFLFTGDDIEKRVATLSGGERARVTIAKLILSKVNLLILDEPTNHLDINSREVL